MIKLQKHISYKMDYKTNELTITGITGITRGVGRLGTFNGVNILTSTHPAYSMKDLYILGKNTDLDSEKISLEPYKKEIKDVIKALDIFNETYNDNTITNNKEFYLIDRNLKLFTKTKIISINNENIICDTVFGELVTRQNFLFELQDLNNALDQYRAML